MMIGEGFGSSLKPEYLIHFQVFSGLMFMIARKVDTVHSLVN